MEERIDTLEMAMSYQEDTVRTLNEVVIDQGKKIEELELQIRKLTQKLEDLIELAGEDSMPHERPPHY